MKGKGNKLSTCIPFRKEGSHGLIDVLTHAPRLTCTSVPYHELLALQLQKLAVNCVLNPTTALLDILNGGMLHNDPLTHLRQAIAREISSVILQAIIPKLATSQEESALLHDRFNWESLDRHCLEVITRNATNSSSMREDFHNGKAETEVRYINGYAVRRGREVGIDCPVNETLVHLVEGRTRAHS